MVQHVFQLCIARFKSVTSNLPSFGKHSITFLEDVVVPHILSKVNIEINFQRFFGHYSESSSSFVYFVRHGDEKFPPISSNIANMHTQDIKQRGLLLLLLCKTVE